MLAIKKILELLIKPFKKDFSTFIIILLLTTVTSLYYYIDNNLFSYSFYILMQGIVIAYIITFFITLITHKSIKNIILFLLYILLGILLILDIFCIYKYQNKFNEEFIAIILHTNKTEAIEFLNEYLNTKILTLILCSFIIIKTIANLIKKYIHISRKVSYVCLSIFIVCSTLTARNYTIYLNDGLSGHIASVKRIINEYALNIDIKQFYTNPPIEIPEKRPENIVLIIGESFNKHHSSLYGYNKKTNPKLEEYYNNLFVFKNVTSPTTRTNTAFQCILNTYKPEYKKEIKWYTCTSLPEILQICGYYTYWISNQNEKGCYDICASKFAKLCNEKFFTEQMQETNNKNNNDNERFFDEKILQLIKPLTENNKHNFYFINLMGSHIEYQKRYPEIFNIFTDKDYADKPKNQRETLAQYDNSILYNDSVIYEIINIFKEKESIIIYTSDHGQDIYQSSPEYVGHGITGDSISEKAGKEIPFIVYTSPLYMQHYPEEIDILKKSINTTFRTDDLIYTIMDIIGAKFKENDDVKKYSLFSKE